MHVGHRVLDTGSRVASAASGHAQKLLVRAICVWGWCVLGVRGGWRAGMQAVGCSKCAQMSSRVCGLRAFTHGSRVRTWGLTYMRTGRALGACRQGAGWVCADVRATCRPYAGWGYAGGQTTVKQLKTGLHCVAQSWEFAT